MEISLIPYKELIVPSWRSLYSHTERLFDPLLEISSIPHTELSDPSQRAVFSCPLALSLPSPFCWFPNSPKITWPPSLVLFHCSVPTINDGSGALKQQKAVQAGEQSCNNPDSLQILGPVPSLSPGWVSCVWPPSHGGAEGSAAPWMPKFGFGQMMLPALAALSSSSALAGSAQITQYAPHPVPRTGLCVTRQPLQARMSWQIP